MPDFISGAISRGRSLEDRLGRHDASVLADINNTGNERASLRRSGSSVLAQKFGRVTGVAGNLRQTLRRGKARQQIEGRGEPAIANQQLKDRVSMARRNLSRRGVGLRGLGVASRMRTDIANARQTGADRVDAAKFGAFGAVAGGLTSAFGEKLFDRGGTVTPEMDEGTAAADFFNTNDDFTFDPLAEPDPRFV